MSEPLLSVVTTAYNSAFHIEKFLNEMQAVLSEVDCQSEIIVVDDGSSDNTVEICRAQLRGRPDLILVELSRNFGQEAATLEAMKHARGQFIFLLDSDLEEPPRTLIEMLAVMRREWPVVDLVYGVQPRRAGPLHRAILSSLFYRVVNRFSDIKLPADVLPIRLMTRRFLDALLTHKERTLALAGLFLLAGFEQRAIPVNKTYKGYSSYNLAKKLGLVFRYVLILSSKPAMAITSLGVCSAVLAMLYGAFAIIGSLLSARTVPGWASLAVLIVFFDGLLLISVGICAAYLAFIFQEVKARPLTIVKSVNGNSVIASNVPEVPKLRQKCTKSDVPRSREPAATEGVR